MTESRPGPDPARAAEISPSLALDLRLRRLEATVGSGPLASSPSSKAILLRALAAQQQIDASTSTHTALRRFASEFESNRRILDSALRLSDSTQANAHETLSAADKILLVQEAEAEMRAMERVLLECQALDARGVAGSGTLSECDTLQPSLSRLSDAQRDEIAIKHDQLEERLFHALETYQSNVSLASASEFELRGVPD